jgi:hypothetical protein
LLLFTIVLLDPSAVRGRIVVTLPLALRYLGGLIGRDGVHRNFLGRNNRTGTDAL